MPSDSIGLTLPWRCTDLPAAGFFFPAAAITRVLISSTQGPGIELSDA